jgi:branched-chain amino acid transport system permease protein
MQALGDFWRGYQSTIAFAIVNAFFALSTYVVLSAGILSFATVTAAIGGCRRSAGAADRPRPLFLLPAAAGAGALLAHVVALIFLRLESH